MRLLPLVTFSSGLLIVGAAVFTASHVVKADEPEYIPVSPGTTIQNLVDQYPEGTRFLLKAGIHRMQQVRPKHGDVFAGESGTILNGSELLTGFNFEGGNWVINGQQQRSGRQGECVSTSPRCAYSEDLYFDDVPLHHVASASQVRPGSWFFDYDARRIYLGNNPEGHKVELGSARYAFHGAARDVTIRGMTIEKYANPAQVGAVHGRVNNSEVSRNWIVQDNVIRLNHGTGIRIGHGMRILRNQIVRNGQMGIGDIGDGVVVDNNEIAFNNYAGFNAGWEGGGAKFVSTRGLIVRYNYSHDNDGTGLWTDIDNVQSLYEFNKVYNNVGPGIQHEISYEAVIRHNDVRGNGTGGDTWGWGSQILVQNSRGVEVHDNYVEVASPKGNGIFLLQQNRGSGAYGVYVTVNNYVHHNEIVYKGTNGASGASADYDPDTMYSGNNRFDRNGYRGPALNLSRWEWKGRGDWQSFRNQGQDVNGWIQSNP